MNESNAEAPAANNPNKAYITTIGGRRFDPVDPAQEDIDITDIAHSLSLICRANGHFREFFSVARHCINCAREAEARGYSSFTEIFSRRWELRNRMRQRNRLSKQWMTRCCTTNFSLSTGTGS